MRGTYLGTFGGAGGVYTGIRGGVVLVRAGVEVEDVEEVNSAETPRSAMKITTHSGHQVFLRLTTDLSGGGRVGVLGER